MGENAQGKDLQVAIKLFKTNTKLREDSVASNALKGIHNNH